jgi:hypothetical protein
VTHDNDDCNQDWVNALEQSVGMVTPSKRNDDDKGTSSSVPAKGKIVATPTAATGAAAARKLFMFLSLPYNNMTIDWLIFDMSYNSNRSESGTRGRFHAKSGCT